MPEETPYIVEPMSLADLDQVMAIEQVSFPAPWPRRAYEYEVSKNEHSIMLVIRERQSTPPSLTRVGRAFRPFALGPVLGYAGSWLLVDELHISTIAVAPQWRQRGLAQQLLIELLKRGAVFGAQRATLEVRASNTAAQKLYHKCGFSIVSKQNRYYADNEDAYIMARPLSDVASERECIGNGDMG